MALGSDGLAKRAPGDGPGLTDALLDLSERIRQVKEAIPVVAAGVGEIVAGAQETRDAIEAIRGVTDDNRHEPVLSRLLGPAGVPVTVQADASTFGLVGLAGALLVVAMLVRRR